MSNDGGPAFPGNSGNPGMLLRDYFAGQALAGLLAKTTVNHEVVNYQARTAYSMADAMLVERSKTKDGELPA